MVRVCYGSTDECLVEKAECSSCFELTMSVVVEKITVTFTVKFRPGSGPKEELSFPGDSCSETSHESTSRRTRGGTLLSHCCSHDEGSIDLGPGGEASWADGRRRTSPIGESD